MLRSMGSQTIGHNWATEQQQQEKSGLHTIRETKKKKKSQENSHLIPIMYCSGLLKVDCINLALPALFD